MNQNQMNQMPIVQHVLPDFLFNEASAYNKGIKIVGFVGAACATIMGVDVFLRNTDSFLMSLRK